MIEVYFRGKNVFNNEWLFGAYSSVYGGKPIIITDCDMEDDCSVDFEYEHVQPDTVGQYTGIKDVNNKRIFEGDIVVNSFPTSLSNKPHVIEWRDGRFTYISDRLSSGGLRPVKIIGNIYDDPELLKENE